MKQPFSKIPERDGSEIALRLALVSRLKQTFENAGAVFAAEARYGSEDRRADFLVLSNEAHAFEIKSDFDSLSRLSRQISDYSASFDYVSVVTTKRHMSKVRSLVPRKIGLLLYADGELSPIRAASKNLRLSKIHLAGGCSKKVLKSVVSLVRATDNVGSVKEIAAKNLKVSDLRELFHSELMRRYASTSDCFMRDTDGQLHAEDLLLLRRAYKIAA